MKRISYFLIDTRYDQLLQSTEMQAPIASAVDYKRSAIRYGGLDAVKFTTLEQSDTTLILEAPDISRRMVVRVTNLDEPAPIYESPEVDYDAIFEAERKQHEREVKVSATLGDEERKRILERGERKKKESAEYLKRKRERETAKIEKERAKLKTSKAKRGRPSLSDNRESRYELAVRVSGNAQTLLSALSKTERYLEQGKQLADTAISGSGLKRLETAIQRSVLLTDKIQATLLDAINFCKVRDEALKAPASSDAEIRKNDERAHKLAEKSRLKGERQKERKNATIVADDFSDLL